MLLFYLGFWGRGSCGVNNPGRLVATLVGEPVGICVYSVDRGLGTFLVGVGRA